MANRFSKRNGGFSAAEFSAGLVLVMAAVFGLEWAGEASDARAHDLQRHEQAVAIAKGQSAVVMSLPFERLAPSNTYIPAPWVNQPGFAAGEVPIEIRVDGELEGGAPVIYHVNYFAENVDRSGRMRRVNIQVAWEKADGSTGAYTFETMRAG